MHDCTKCKCLTCERIGKCTYHDLCSVDNGQTKEYVKECKDYIYSKENDKYFNG